MARKVKRITRKTLRIERVATLLFMLSLMFFLVSSIFLRSYNVNLSVQRQNVEKQIAATELQNESLRVEVAQLSTYDRIAAIAAADGLTLHQNNIVTVKTSE